jgi:hypothetical protein
MDKSKPSISPGELFLRSGSEGTSADVDPPPAELAKSDQFAAAVYYRNEEEVREGFLIALAAMGIAGVEELPKPTKPPVGRTKP